MLAKLASRSEWRGLHVAPGLLVRRRLIYDRASTRRGPVINQTPPHQENQGSTMSAGPARPARSGGMMTLLPIWWEL